MSVQILLVTAPEDKAKSIASYLLEKRLAACVNILPSIQSLYWWEGKIEESQEALLMIKTTGEKQQALMENLKEIHPYDVPEMLFLPVDHGFPPYLEWVNSEVKGSERP